MSGSRKWSVIITFVVIFLAGLIFGLWYHRQPITVYAPPPPPSPSKYEALESGEAVVISVYRTVSPAVVNIVATSLSVNYWMQVVPQVGQGSGFVIDANGHILTNNHVVSNAEDLEVTFLGERKIKAKLVGKDPVSDLAVIRVEPFSGMMVAPLGNSDDLVVGQRAIAIGNPFGFQHTVTAGFLSALNRDLTIGQRTMMGLIQTDAAINPGNSGGPLINSRGEVMGINTAIYSQTGGFMGIGLAVPINKARKVADQIIKHGRMIYPWIGIQSYMDLEPRVSELMGIGKVRGVLIFQVSQNSPAAKAGLKGGNQIAYYGNRPVVIDGRPLILGGDVVTAVDGVPISNYEEFQAIILGKNVGDTVKITYLRDGKEASVDIKLTEDSRIRQ